MDSTTLSCWPRQDAEEVQHHRWVQEAQQLRHQQLPLLALLLPQLLLLLAVRWVQTAAAAVSC
jgi:hypothetical protein